MARSKKTQSKHDSTVKKIASQLQKKGYEVQADIPGFQQPKTISGYRPDVVGTKGKQRQIVEVETPDSVDSTRDVKQQKAFQQAANRSKNTTFKRKLT
jgi:peptidoglycan hydrolase-like protein with peptidoglycan-binding domain